MKEKTFYFVICLFLLAETACSSDNNGNPFIGQWQIVGIEEEDGITDYLYGNQIVNFSLNGLYSTESSKSVQKIIYSFNEQELYLYYDFEKRTDIYSYSFSDDGMTLRIMRTKRGVSTTIMYVVDSPDLLTGKMQVLKRISY